jgi:hypothetical protein
MDPRSHGTASGEPCQAEEGCPEAASFRGQETVAKEAKVSIIIIIIKFVFGIIIFFILEWPRPSSISQSVS